MISAVIPAYNGARFLKKVLADLRAQTLVPDEILVVDNGSTDDSAAVAEAAGARVLRQSTNSGFCRAVNRGMEEARGDWLVVLNNDVELRPDWLAELVRGAIEGGARFATGKILSAQERTRVDGSFDAVCLGGCAWRCGSGRLDGAIWDQPRTIQFAPFTAVLIAKSLIGQIGMLDERFGSYLEDVDFGLRCAIQDENGVYVPSAVAYHHGSATLGRWHAEIVRNIARNQVMLVAKHYPAGWLVSVGWKVLIAQLLWGFVAIRHGSGWSWFWGKYEGFREFRVCRQTGPRKVLDVLKQSEGEIRTLQRASGFDLYWRTYFWLT
ncbi:MAG TPA: glycosyltransferase [Bryobacteraceae bacterium]|nr:glycosyltransferase [Bryobacteraceae bacterium]